jgi:hypothetical protein
MHEHQDRDARPERGKERNGVHFVDDDVKVPRKGAVIAAKSFPVNCPLKPRADDPYAVELLAGWSSRKGRGKPFDVVT